MKCMSRSLALICVLLLLGSSALRAQATDQERLLAGIRSNDTKAIASILQQQPALCDSSYTSSNGWFSTVTAYPIHEALRYGNTATINQLLDLGADPARVEETSAMLSSRQRSCLEILVAYRDLDMLTTFIDRVAVSPEGYTRALLVASQDKDAAKVKFLLSLGEKYLLKEDK